MSDLTEPVRDAPRGGAAAAGLPRLLYGLAAGGFLAVIAWVSVDPVAVISYERDIWHHLSVYRELIADPFHAANPHVATDDPSRSYSPWTMGVAFLARGLGLDQFGAIAISAILSAAAILAGIHAFARSYWQGAPWAPLLFLAASFGTWMFRVNHTGYHTIETMLFSVSYPFAIVLGAGFLSWAVAIRALRAPRIGGHAAVLAVLAYAMFVTHQLQGLFAIGGTLGFLIFAGAAPARRRRLLAAAVLAGLAATRWWWYFDPIAYILDDTVRQGHDAPRFLQYSFADLPEIVATLGLACFGVLGFYDAGRRRLRPELLLPFLAILAGFLGLIARDNWVSVRVLPFLAVYLQIGLVAALVDLARDGGDGAALRRGCRAGLSAAMGFLLALNAVEAWRHYAQARNYLETGAATAPPDTWNAAIVEAAQFAETLVPPGSVAIAHRQTAFPIEATTLAVVAIPRLFAEVADMGRRQADNRAFFEPGMPRAARCAILNRYDVALIVWRDLWLAPGEADALAAFGEVRRAGDLAFVAAGTFGFRGCGA